MTILNTFYNYHCTLLTAFLIFLFLAFATAAIIVYECRGKILKTYFAATVILAILSITSCVCSVMSREKVTTIECILDDTYPVMSLYENYEIKDRRGDIWVLTEVKKEEE